MGFLPRQKKRVKNFPLDCRVQSVNGSLGEVVLEKHSEYRQARQASQLISGCWEPAAINIRGDIEEGRNRETAVQCIGLIVIA